MVRPAALAPLEYAYSDRGYHADDFQAPAPTRGVRVIVRARSVQADAGAGAGASAAAAAAAARAVTTASTAASSSGVAAPRSMRMTG
ncbi:hypothetical protein BIV57_04870 [Mangrovactinospora gilvigrisea]|uniref:Uncharacterized protein n=1 Tax=Mangrovactinospora gilvigrisea TaxID=1428644 RepID=A0A1J7BIX3_9ACTN|nr:hypothetical protein BIV57_04870 [Mangrovactinospora gilvigrisea]